MSERERRPYIGHNCIKLVHIAGGFVVGVRNEVVQPHARHIRRTVFVHLHSATHQANV